MPSDLPINDLDHHSKSCVLFVPSASQEFCFCCFHVDFIECFHCNSNCDTVSCELTLKLFLFPMICCFSPFPSSMHPEVFLFSITATVKLSVAFM